MSHSATMFRPRPPQLPALVCVSILLAPGLAHARAFGGRFMGFVLFAPGIFVLLLAAIAAFTTQPPGPVTRGLQAALLACVSACVGLSVSLFQVSQLWFGLGMALVFALAKRRGPRHPDLSWWAWLLQVTDLPMLGVAYAPGLLTMLLWA